MNEFVPDSVDSKIEIVFAKGEELNQLEKQYDCTQTEVIDYLIEDSSWGEESYLKNLRNRQGTAEERLTIFRLVYLTQVGRSAAERGESLDSGPFKSLIQQLTT